MYLSTETCWLYPASSTAVTCTAEPLPGSPGSISPATVSSSPQAPFSSPATGEIYSSVISRNSPRVHSTSSLSPATSPGYRTEDDWTMVKDLGERRKIQNRVAQRRYRESAFFYCPFGFKIRPCSGHCHGRKAMSSLSLPRTKYTPGLIIAPFSKKNM